MRMALTRWQFFVDWLGFGISGIHPTTLWRTLGPVGFLLPVARQMADSVGPWLVSLLAERERRGLAWSADCDQRQVAADLAVQPLRTSDAQRDTSWLIWLLEGDLARLARLTEAPEALMQRRNWVPWQVRYWALAVGLVRLGLGYWVLTLRLGNEEAQRCWEEVTARVWRRASGEQGA